MDSECYKCEAFYSWNKNFLNFNLREGYGCRYRDEGGGLGVSNIFVSHTHTLISLKRYTQAYIIYHKKNSHNSLYRHWYPFILFQWRSETRYIRITFYCRYVVSICVLYKPLTNTPAFFWFLFWTAGWYHHSGNLSACIYI
jgi:hypothetical protein